MLIAEKFISTLIGTDMAKQLKLGFARHCGNRRTAHDTPLGRCRVQS
jgi:hypothetical protein